MRRAPASLDPGAQSPIRRRQVSRLAEKSAIGRLAATFVEEGMTLLPMGGTRGPIRACFEKAVRRLCVAGA